LSSEGVLVIDKPVGPTSHDVVARVRRALREKRIGHTGTLDPLASGVLPLVIGRATRLSSLLSAAEKEYEAGVRLGVATETYDAAGLPPGALPPPAPALDRSAVEAALTAFRGPFAQTPPPFSAKKVAGVPSYKLARRQQAPVLAAVPVATHALTVTGLDAGLLTLRMVTTPGFYVRSLAHDLGAALGCGAHLESLRRTRSGAFDLTAAVALEDVERDPQAAMARMIPLEQLVPELPALRLNARGAQKAAHGNALAVDDFAEAAAFPTGARVRVFDPAGRLLGLATAGPDGLLRPSVVLV
jgi:tRNA pseudouridine55 synthase